MHPTEETAYNEAVQLFRDRQYPMLKGTSFLRCDASTHANS